MQAIILRAFLVLPLVAFAALAPAKAGDIASKYCPAEKADKERFGEYISCAVNKLANERKGFEYGPHWFTQTLDYGDPKGKEKVPRFPPGGERETMCDSAVAETLIEALNLLYDKELGSDSDFVKLKVNELFPAANWSKVNYVDGILWYIGEDSTKDKQNPTCAKDQVQYGDSAAQALEK